MSVTTLPSRVVAARQPGWIARLFDYKPFLIVMCLTPALGLLGVFLTYPLGLGVWLAFTDTTIGKRGVFVGFENFSYLLTDPLWWNAVFYSVFYTAVATFGKFALGFWLALLLNNHFPLKSLLRAIVLLPVDRADGAFGAGVLVDLRSAVLDHLLSAGRRAAYPHHQCRLSGNAVGGAVLADRGQHLARHPLCRNLAAGRLQTISPSLYEAAMLDGASAWQRFRYITFPMMMPILAIVMTFSIIFHLHRLPARLRHHPRRPRQLHPFAGYAGVPARIAGGELGEGAAIAVSMIPSWCLQRCSVTSASPAANGSREKPMTDVAAQPTNTNVGSATPDTMSWDSRARRVMMIYLPLSCFVLICCSRSTGWRSLRSKPNAELLNFKDHNPFWISSPTLAHIKHLLFNTAYPTWLKTTMFVAICSTFLSLFASTLAAYAIERLRFRGSPYVGLGIYLAYLVPPSILFIPLATVIVQFGLFDSPLALILVYPTFLWPFCTWLLIGYFKSIPYELEECALVDGATRLQICGGSRCRWPCPA